MNLMTIVARMLLLSAVVLDASAQARGGLNEVGNGSSNRMLDYLQTLQAGGTYTGFKAVSFKETRDNSAISTLHEAEGGGKEQPIYHLMVARFPTGPNIGFQVYNGCSEVADGIRETSIRVDGQKIAVGMGCAAWTRAGTYRALYMIKTKKGTDFVRRALMRERYIFVDFGRVTIPFKTAGFAEVWADVNEVAL